MNLGVGVDNKEDTTVLRAASTGRSANLNWPGRGR